MAAGPAVPAGASARHSARRHDAAALLSLSIPAPIASPSAWAAGSWELASSPPRSERDATRRVAASPPLVAVLIGIEGKHQGEVYRVRDGENRLGRLQGAEICLGVRDDTVSREHAVILHRGGAFGLRPLRKENPTWVNGEEVDGGTALSDGDRIRIGESCFRFRTA